MDVETIVSLVSSVGFPILCCVYMWKYINDTLKDFTETMNKNTLMLEKMYERLGGDKRE